MSKVLQERGFGSLPSSTKTNPMDHFKSISTSVEADTSPIRRIGSSKYAVSVQYNNVEDMDPYLDEGMGEVVVGEPFLRNTTYSLYDKAYSAELASIDTFIGFSIRRIQDLAGTKSTNVGEVSII
nr:hypothetical protein [Tanacetum cinerariifolium]